MYRRNALKACAVVLAFPLVVSERKAHAAAVERVIGKVGRNHGHVLAVSVADVAAGVPKTYDINGTSGHSHEVSLSADDFKVLQGGGVVRTNASRYDGRGHLHRVLVKTAPAVDPPEAIPVVDATFSGKDDHELVIGAPAMAAKADVTFDVQGIAPHGHSLTITAADFARLASGAEIRLQTTRGDDHTHAVFLHYPGAKRP